MDINYVFAGGIGLLSGLALSQYVYALLRQQMIRRVSQIASQLEYLPPAEVPPKLWSVEEMRVFSHAVVVLLEGMLPLREEAPPLAPEAGPDLLSEPSDLRAFFEANPDFSFRDHMTRLEIAFIKGALAQCQGSVSAAARLLGLQRTTLIEKMRKYSLQREEA